MSGGMEADANVMGFGSGGMKCLKIRLSAILWNM